MAWAIGKLGNNEVSTCSLTAMVMMCTGNMCCMLMEVGQLQLLLLLLLLQT